MIWTTFQYYVVGCDCDTIFVHNALGLLNAVSCSLGWRLLSCTWCFGIFIKAVSCSLGWICVVISKRKWGLSELRGCVYSHTLSLSATMQASLEVVSIVWLSRLLLLISSMRSTAFWSPSTCVWRHASCSIFSTALRHSRRGCFCSVQCMGSEPSRTARTPRFSNFLRTARGCSINSCVDTF